MSDKSYVALELNRCPVCGAVHETGSILLHKQMKDVFPTARRYRDGEECLDVGQAMHDAQDNPALTGWSLCDKCQTLKDDCFIALIEAVPPDAPPGPDGVTHVAPDEVERLGRIYHIHESAWRRFTDVPVPEGYVAYVESDVLDMLVDMYEREHGEPPGNAEDREPATPTKH